MSKVAKLADARVKRELTTKVYDCGKCHEQGAQLHGNGNVACGGKECDARWAADWYEPTDMKSKAKYMRPRLDPDNIYRCATCLFPFFHIQSDGSITCYREQCKRKALFRWHWMEDLPKGPRRA